MTDRWPTESGADERPELRAGLSPEQFDRWYWTVADLRDGARVRAALAGDIVANVPTKVPRDSLTGVLTVESRFTPPQRMTRALRAFMVEQCGPGFRFDAHMREFFSGMPSTTHEEDGRPVDPTPEVDLTLGNAVDHWQRTRDRPSEAIESQFEYNRFVRAWRAERPGASHSEVVTAWHQHRSTPRD
jgi:hypothetical protein